MSTQHATEFTPDLGQQHRMTAEVDTHALLHQTASLAAFADAVVLEFRADDIYCDAVAEDHTVAVETSLDADYTTDHHATSVTVRPAELHNAVPSDPEPTTSLTLKEDKDYLAAGSGNLLGYADLYDPSEAADAVDLGGFDYDYEATVAARDLRRAVAGVADMGASHLYLGGRSDSLEVRADRGLDESFGRSEPIDAVPSSGRDGFGFIYASPEKRRIFDALPIGDDVLVCLGGSAPVRIEAESGIRFDVAQPALEGSEEIHEAIRAGEHDG